MCDNASLYENLVIDGYFQEVIASQKLGVDDNEIQLHPDGSWSTLANKPDLYSLETPKKCIQKVEVISDDLGTTYFQSTYTSCLKYFVAEMITEDYPKSTIKSHLTSVQATNTSKPSADTVDLTIDSDDDEPSKKSALKSAPQKAKNGM